jgi:hypothetical protein
VKITVWLIPTRQRFDNCLLKKFNYICHSRCFGIRGGYGKSAFKLAVKLYPITPQKLLKLLDLVVYIENGWSLSIIPGDQKGLFKLAVQLRKFYISVIYNTATGYVLLVYLTNI